MKVTTVGFDLAKQVFLSARGWTNTGKAVLKKRVSRGKLLELFVQLPPSSGRDGGLLRGASLGA